MKSSEYYHTLKLHLILFAAVLLTGFLIFLIPGCNGDSPEESTGTLRVSLTDAPACGFEAVNVTIDKVRIHQSRNATENDPGWSEINLAPARKINLLDLTHGLMTTLGETPLPAGHYTQLRLLLAENSAPNLANSVVPTGMLNEVEIKTPSAMQSGLKLTHGFEVMAGMRVDLLLDFDACKSVVRRGNGDFLLKPVIRVIPFTVNGIEGVVSPANNVTVAAQKDGEIIRSTSANPNTGSFFISHLTPDTYDVVITAAGHATTIVTGVSIATATSTTIISTAAEPILLADSESSTINGTILLTPPIPETTTVADVTAKQTVPGTTVTVASQTIALPDSTYTLTLPSAAPWLGSYGDGTLPIALSEQTETAGEYSLAVAASGYITQSEEIGPETISQNFVLSP